MEVAMEVLVVGIEKKKDQADMTGKTFYQQCLLYTAFAFMPSHWWGLLK